MNGLRPIAAVALFLTLACSKEKQAAPSGPPPNAKLVDLAKAAKVAGRVVIEGTVPANPPIKLSADPYCMRENPNGATFENYVTEHGGLDNVFVYVKHTFDYYFEVPTKAAKLDQKGCRYTPHVLGVRVGQPLAVSNSDDTLHTVHVMPAANTEWNKGQALKNMVNEKVFTAPEVMVPVKCDVHNWMSAYIGVVDHPYFEVSHDGGRFELKNLPAGTYTVEAWHEKLGTQAQTVTIAEKESKDITFTFKASTTASN